jgi:hypothetical protein
MLGFSLAAVGTACLDLSGGCANDLLSEITSPGGDRRAVVFQRDCGATTGFSTQVSVLAVGSALPDSGGNVFSADTDHGKAPAGPGGGPRVDVRWVTPQTLEVRYDGRARVFTHEPRYAGTEVRFVAEPRAP